MKGNFKDFGLGNSKNGLAIYYKMGGRLWSGQVLEAKIGILSDVPMRHLNANVNYDVRYIES